MKTAVFIDIVSIQKYIFSSNKLKENIGASYIIEKIMENLSKFKHSYIGGGNAILYFDDKNSAINEMKKWTANLMINYPGITPIVVIDDKFDEKDYINSRDKLIKKAFEIKNSYLPIVDLSSFGFSAICPFTSLSANIYEQKEQKYISFQSYSKIKASEKADENLDEKFKDVLNNKKFPNELDNLGGSIGSDNHIAVVHIDGNDIGEKFKSLKSEEELKNLSSKLKEAIQSTFKMVIRKMMSNWEDIESELDIKRNYVPIRPIILGGDDITFVCDARLSFYFTYNFIKYFKKQDICKNNEITASAGISIVKTKYPFYRAYSLAEELCKNAKNVIRQGNSSQSFIDFHIAFGGFSGSLDELREKHYTSFDNKKMYMRPYSLTDIKNLFNAVKDFKKIPQSKVKKMRDVLAEGEAETANYINELKFRDIKLPFISHSDEAEKGFLNKKTPYLDIIEIMDFCPDFFIKEA